KYSVVDGDPLRPLGLTKVGLNKNNLVRVWGKIVKSESSAEGPSCVIDNGSGSLTVKGINGSVGDFIKVIGISTPSGVRYIPRFD
ncbi:MAG: hypothetical protein J6U98_05445, partial [Abditibacteriota bacterium]|nr:hypothetical protein [Abditibacteriota bacterium]